MVERKKPELRVIRSCEMGWYRLDNSPCRLECAYCISGEISRSRHAPDKIPAKIHFKNSPGKAAPHNNENPPPDRNKILKDVETLLSFTPESEPLHLTADDLIELPFFIDILKAFKRHGRRLDLVTPGLRLADPAFAKAVSRFDVHFTVTYLAATKRVYTRLAGNPTAQALIRRAMDNMMRFNIPFSVNCVATSLNCDELEAVARYLFSHVERQYFTILYLYLEQTLVDANPGAPKLLASYNKLDRQLSKIVRLCEEMDKVVVLVDVPLCQLSPGNIANPRIRYRWDHLPSVQIDSPTPFHRTKSCDRCPLNNRCSHVSKYYAELHPGMKFDYRRVIKHLQGKAFG